MTLQHRFVEEGRKEGIKEGRKEGVKEGIKKGRERGREEGERSVLLKLIALKFGPPSAATLTRIQAADSRQLSQWTERFLSATTLDDLWS